MASSQQTSTETKQPQDVNLSRDLSFKDLRTVVTGQSLVEMAENACEKLEGSGDISGDDNVLKLIRIAIQSRRLLLIRRAVSQAPRYLSQAGKNALTEIVAKEDDAQLAFLVFRHAGDRLDESLWTLIDMLRSNSYDREALSVLRYASDRRLSEKQMEALESI